MGGVYTRKKQMWILEKINTGKPFWENLEWVKNWRAAQKTGKNSAETSMSSPDLESGLSLETYDAKIGTLLLCGSVAGMKLNSGLHIPYGAKPHHGKIISLRCQIHDISHLISYEVFGAIIGTRRVAAHSDAGGAFMAVLGLLLPN